MKLAAVRLLFPLMLAAAGCASPTAETVPVLQARTVSATVVLGHTRTTLSTVHRWVQNDINLYRVSMSVYNSTSGLYDPVSSIPTTDVTQKGTPLHTATFSNLAPGYKYRATVQAWGNAGGTAATTQLNTATATVADFDFTASQDIVAAQSVSTAVSLDEVPFAGTLVVTPTGRPDGTRRYDVELLKGGVATLTSNLTSTPTTLTFDSLSLGFDYQVRLTAKTTSGRILAVATSGIQNWSATGQDVEQTVTLPFAFPSPIAAISGKLQ